MTDSPATDRGAEGQECFQDGTCKSGLVCTVNRCRVPDGGVVDATSDAGGSETSGSDGSVADAPTTDATKLGCDGSACVPFLVSDDFLTGSSIAVTSTDVVFGAGGTVARCPKTGCKGSPTTLATMAGPASVATDGTTVFITPYVASGSGLFACALTGCNGTPTPLVSNQSYAGLTTIRGSTVFWLVNAGAVHRCPLPSCAGGGSLANLVTGYTYAAGTTSIYATQSNSVISVCDENNCSGTIVNMLSGLVNPAAMVEVGSTFYVASSGASDGKGTVISCTRSGNACTGVQTLASNLTNPEKLIIDGNRFYVMERGTGAGTNAQISYGATSGGGATPLVTSNEKLMDMADDGANIFFITAGGKVRGIAKP